MTGLPGPGPRRQALELAPRSVYNMGDATTETGGGSPWRGEMAELVEGARLESE
jgi:hypothetical protein